MFFVIADFAIVAKKGVSKHICELNALVLQVKCVFVINAKNVYLIVMTK